MEKKTTKNCLFKVISGKIFHPLNDAVNNANGGTQNGSTYQRSIARLKAKASWIKHQEVELVKR